VHGVVVAAEPKQVQPQRQPEAQHRTQATPTASIKSVIAGNGDDPDTWEARLIAS
jgi:hypothetical protein